MRDEERSIAFPGCIYSLGSVASRVYDNSNRQSAEGDYLVDNPSRRCPVITKARTELGYEPLIDIDEGLRRSLVWYSYNRKAAEA